MRKALVLITAVTLACGAASAPPASTNTATTAPAATTAPTASVPQTSPARTATPTGNPAAAAEVTLRWEAGTNVGDIDDVTDIINHLKEKPGIAGGYGDELQIVVAYDPQKITVDQIRRLLSDMGFPTKAPGS